MRRQQKKRLRIQAQAILFCSIFFWMLANLISAIPAMAFHPEPIPKAFTEYNIVASYKGYTYASEGPQGNATVASNVNGTSEILCELNMTPTGIDLVQECNVPIGIARHLKVLGHKGMSHDLVVVENYMHY